MRLVSFSFTTTILRYSTMDIKSLLIFRLRSAIVVLASSVASLCFDRGTESFVRRKCSDVISFSSESTLQFLR